jgi:hypothetical protein
MMERKSPNCLNCIHYYVTWDPQLPKGCKAFHFKTKKIPSQSVKDESGKECQMFLDKKKAQDTYR